MLNNINHPISVFPSVYNQDGFVGLDFFVLADFYSTYYVSSYLSYETKLESNLLKSRLFLIASNA